MSNTYTKGYELIQQIAPGATMLCEQIERLERSLRNDDYSETLDYSKSLLESLFKTIICDIDGSIDDGLDFPQLFREVRNKLRFSTDDQAHDWLGQICSTAIAKIAELRNRFGVIGHGAEGYTGRPFGKLETEFVAGITDSIVCFLFQIHKTNPERFLNQRIHYGDNPDFNDWLNGQQAEFRMKLGNENDEEEIVYLASEIIFNSDYVTYKELLVQFRQGLSSDDDPVLETEQNEIYDIDPTISLSPA